MPGCRDGHHIRIHSQAQVLTTAWGPTRALALAGRPPGEPKHPIGDRGRPGAAGGEISGTLLGGQDRKFLPRFPRLEKHSHETCGARCLEGRTKKLSVKLSFTPHPPRTPPKPELFESPPLAYPLRGHRFPQTKTTHLATAVLEAVAKVRLDAYCRPIRQGGENDTVVCLGAGQTRQGSEDGLMNPPLFAETS